jgi:hypothetical protein
MKVVLSRVSEPLALPAGEFRLVAGKPRRGFKHLPVLLAQAWLARARIELPSPAWHGMAGPWLPQ